MTQARHLDNDVLIVWKFLLREGGYWTAREIREHWEPTYTGGRVRNILDRAVANELVREKARPRAHTAYGVTECCKAPPGYEWMLDMAVNAIEPIDWPVVEALHA